MRCTFIVRRNYRLSLKYPALVSYNKLPWETLAPDSPALHQHVAPHYQHILQLAATTFIPRLLLPGHPTVPPSQRMRVLPGMIYLLPDNGAEPNPTSASSLSSSSSTGGAAPPPPPPGFTRHAILDTVSLQHYGQIHHCVAKVQHVHLLTSEDLKLLCLQLTLQAPFHLPCQVGSSLAVGPAPAGSQTSGASAAVVYPRFTADHTPPSGDGQQTSRASASSSRLSLFHFFRPHRSPAELTRPLERFLSQHKPFTDDLIADFAGEGNHSQWVPVLQPPKRVGSKGKGGKLQPTMRATMPAYKPPQSYLMGLAERLAVRPGDCFGRRSLMWGHWF